MHTSFDAAHAALFPDIRRTAVRQRVPGMTTQEVENEMVYALWKACKAYDPTTGDGQITLARYWWRVWMNHKANLIEAAMAKKRQMVVLIGGMDDAGCEEDYFAKVPMDEFVDLIPPCPSEDPLHQQVWNLLARGYLFNEIQERLGLKRRAFDTIVASLRTAWVPAPGM